MTKKLSKFGLLGLCPKKMSLLSSNKMPAGTHLGGIAVYPSRSNTPAAHSSNHAEPSVKSQPHVLETLTPKASGLVPLFYLLAFVPGPLLFFIMDDADYSRAGTRALTASVATVGGVLVAIGNAEALTKAVLGFHTGVEAFVCYEAFRIDSDEPASGELASGDTTDDVTRALAYTGASVVIVHLLPFYAFGTPTILRILAFVGIIVNVLLVLLVSPEKGDRLLLLVGASAAALLGVSRHLTPFL